MSSAHYQNLLAELADLFPRPESEPAARRQIVEAIERALGLVAPQTSQPESVGGAHPTIDGSAAWLAEAFARLPDWSSPRWRSGLDPQPTLASIASAFLPLVYNPNLVSQASAGGCCQIEQRVVSIVAEWIGYDPQRADGVFTFGGAG